MTDHGTFEVAPPETVAGRETSLVYTRVAERPSDLDVRGWALKYAIDATLTRKSYDGEAVPTDAEILRTARTFHEFLTLKVSE